MSNQYYSFPVPHIQVRNTSLCHYIKCEHNFPSRKKEQFFKKAYTFEELVEQGYSSDYASMVVQNQEQRKCTYSGTITKGSKARIRKAVDLLLQVTPYVRLYNPVIQKEVDHRLSFITLTISCNDRFISGQECYKTCLKPFLQWLQKTRKINTYIWKAERQQPFTKEGVAKGSGGQLHYHITSPAFIMHDELRSKWNYLQQKAGYLDEYFSKYGNYNANSTDIHSVYKVDDLEAYLIKYISKSPTTQVEINGEVQEIPISVEGKVWDCSMNLKGKKYFTIEAKEVHELKLLELLDTGKVEHLPVEQVIFVKGKSKVVQSILLPDEYQQYQEFRLSFNIIEDINQNQLYCNSFKT